MVTKAIGRRLREERERLALNQTAFGAIAGITKKTQMLYEAGERSPDGVYFESVSRAGVDVLYVLTGERQALRDRPVEEETSLERRQQCLIDNWQASVEEDKKVIERLAQLTAAASKKNPKKTAQEGGNG